MGHVLSVETVATGGQQKSSSLSVMLMRRVWRSKNDEMALFKQNGGLDGTYKNARRGERLVHSLTALLLLFACGSAENIRKRSVEHAWPPGEMVTFTEKD